MRKLSYINLPNKEVFYDLNLVSELDELLDTGAYNQLYNVFEYLKSENIQYEILSSSLDKYSSNREEIMRFWAK